MSAEQRGVVVELTYAVALAERDPAQGAPPVFLTPPSALPMLGPDWALDLQAALKAWHSRAVLLVDATKAPGYALQALEKGLARIYCAADHPAFDDLSRYAEANGGTVIAERPLVAEVWPPTLPTRQQKRAAKSAKPTSREHEDTP